MVMAMGGCVNGLFLFACLFGYLLLSCLFCVWLTVDLPAQMMAMTMVMVIVVILGGVDLLLLLYLGKC